jgi:ribA/ribD-fused uncharacterized protein
MENNPHNIDLRAGFSWSTNHSINNKQSGRTVRFTGERDPLSNFFQAKVQIWGHTFHHNEGAYQWKKCKENLDDSRAYRCLSFANPRDAMYTGREVSPSGKWLQERTHFMRELVDAKFEQCPEFRTRLMNTGEALIIEDTTNHFWACGKQNNGLNTMGEILMQKRMDESVWQHQQERENIGYIPHMASSDYNPPCLYCGVTGHKTDNCRHGKYLKCHDCGQWGHKARYCWYQ